jgi:pimeloyl-ACP methyl ester carboxylesterase
MNTSTITLSNTETLFYAEQGIQHKHQRPTLLFVHGNFSASYWWFDIMTALVTQPYHIIAVDLRGFGYSSYNNQCNKFGDWAQDLKEFCHLKDIKSCVAIGWSFGGGVSMKFAELAP